MENIKIIALFLEGLLSFLSPCVLPILPVYIGILAGEKGMDEKGNPTFNPKNILINTLSFVSGIALTFFILAFATNLLSQFFREHTTVIQTISGLLILAMGLLQLGVFKSQFLSREFSMKHKVFGQGTIISPPIAILMGFTFSFSWTPCIGPILGSVLFYASSHQGLMSFLLVLIYSLGFILPFVLIAFFAQKMLDVLKKHQHILAYTMKISGIILILIGLSILFGFFQQMTRFFY